MRTPVATLLILAVGALAFVEDSAPPVRP